jgi:glycerol-3-phosphate dehydrogenase (NAD(P)+)
VSQVICDVLGIEADSDNDRVACLSGPNLADEVAQKKLGASVIAAPCQELSQQLQESFSNNYFRIYRHSDRTGVELGGTLKNIFAIGAGIVDGLELGDNAKAAYLTRSLHELVRLGTALGGDAQTFYGLAGLGDLMATTSSPLSRNHRLGITLQLPITEELCRVLFEGCPPGIAAANLMGRSLKAETD